MIDRREFILWAGAIGMASAFPSISAEGAPETKRIRIGLALNGSCWAPQYVAETLFHAEGFSELRYVPIPGGDVYSQIASGEVDLSMAFIAPFIMQADSGKQVVMLAGVHSGCIELVCSERIRTVRDLKGRTVSTLRLNSPDQAFIASILAHVGLDPRRDVKWVAQSFEEAIRELTDGKVDARIAAPPLSYELRAKKLGRVVVNMSTDRPWSQYFCCVLTGNRDFVHKHPVATKRALRAILKAADLCANDPEHAARSLAPFFGRLPRPISHELALQTVREIPYSRWREYDTEDTVRFYALRLQEAGYIKSNPKKILAESTDFRFINELKKELKS